MTSIYYGMVTEVDDGVGKILKRLDDLELADNTLVVFTSDHGEMLGEHGMHGKFVFYEGSVHVPLLLRLPGAIAPGTVIKAPSSHLDLFSTILDYCGKSGNASEGSSLRPLIEGRWKLLYGRAANAPSLDALYDLQTDPHEVNNLIGNNPKLESVRNRPLLAESPPSKKAQR